jgi:hypothetical protein
MPLRVRVERPVMSHASPPEFPSRSHQRLARDSDTTPRAVRTPHTRSTASSATSRRSPDTHHVSKRCSKRFRRMEHTPNDPRTAAATRTSDSKSPPSPRTSPNQLYEVARLFLRYNVGNDRRAVGGRSPPIDRPCRLTCYAAAAFVSRAARRSVDLLRPRVSLATPYIRACSEWRPASSRSGQGARCATDLHPARGRDQRWSSDLGGRTLLELQRPRARRKAQRRITNAAGERNQTNTVGITRLCKNPDARLNRLGRIDRSDLHLVFLRARPL